jgi:DNA primase
MCYIVSTMKEKLDILSNILGSHFDSNEEHLFSCPYCKHHKNKFSVNIEKNVYKCWICDARGNNIYRIVRRFGSFSNSEAWKAVSGEKIDLNQFENLFWEDTENEEPEQVIDMPPNFKTLTSKALTATGRRAIRYLQSREVNRSDILKWKIGYCNGGPYKNRVIIPSFSEKGNLNYFIARTFSDDYRRYMNPSFSRDIIFNELYVDFDKEVTIVEGVFDALKTENAIPILGSTIREASKIFKKIVKNDTPVLLALDPDVVHKSEKIKKLLLKYGIEVREMKYNDKNRDIGEMSKKEVKEMTMSAPFIRDCDNLISAISTI